MVSASMYGRFQYTTIVRGSGASTRSTALRPTWLNSDRAGSRPTAAASTRSSLVKGAPSCQATPGRSVHVVCIEPSSATSQEPLSVEGKLAARIGTREPLPTTEERRGLVGWIRSGRPGVAVPAGLMCLLMPGGSPAIAMTTRFGPEVTAGSPAAWRPLPVGPAGLAQPSIETRRISPSPVRIDTELLRVGGGRLGQAPGCAP